MPEALRTRPCEECGGALTTLSPGFLGVRSGTADNNPRTILSVGGSNGGNCNVGGIFTMPFSGSNRPYFVWSDRQSVGGATSGCNFANNPWPEITSVPFWVRVVRYSGTIQFFVSADGTRWTTTASCSGVTNISTANCSFDAANMGGTSIDHVELPAGYTTLFSGDGNKGWLEIDSFTLTVN